VWRCTPARSATALNVLAAGPMVRVGDRIVTATPGSYVFKPRGVPHTFRNAGPGPARLIEILWPSGVERFYASGRPAG